MKIKPKQGVQAAFSSLSPKQEGAFRQILETVSKSRLLQPDGNPDPSWMVVYGSNFDDARVNAKELAKNSPKFSRVLEDAIRIEESHALSSRHDPSWNEERRAQRHLCFETVYERIGKGPFVSEHVIDHIGNAVAAKARFEIIKSSGEPQDLSIPSVLRKYILSTVKGRTSLEVDSCFEAVKKGYVPMYSEDGKLVVLAVRLLQKIDDSAKDAARPV